MIKLNIRALGFLVVIFALITSCQKEISHEISTNPTGGGTGGGGNNTGGNLVAKLVTESVLDTSTHTFTYNSAKKFTSHKIFVKGMSGSSDFRRHIIRDAQDKIALVKDSSLAPNGTWDTTTTQIYYSGTSSTAAYAIANTGFGKDSVVYTYTANRITKVTIYILQSGAYMASEEFTYVYDAAGNVTNYKTYDLSNGTPELQDEYKYTFDTKVSPFNFGSEAIIISGFGTIEMDQHVVGPNNVIKLEITDHTNATTDVINTTYTYNSSNKPTKANLSMQFAGLPIGVPALATYYYQ